MWLKSTISFLPVNTDQRSCMIIALKEKRQRHTRSNYLNIAHSEKGKVVQRETYILVYVFKQKVT